MERRTIISKLRRALAGYGIRRAYLFGSFARKERNYNDIDIAIEVPKGMSLLDLAHIENELEKSTRVKIDLGTIDSIHPLVKKSVEKERVVLV